MGVVYAAFDRVRERVVALKCLSPGRVEERSLALFEHEYHVLSQLTHPHIIEAFDYGRDEEGPYYSMECGSGQTLRARTALPWRDACAVMRDVVSALALLHSRSLVHRDLTPLNIDCAPGQPTKLLDFGAMIPTGVPKQIVGTPAFMAPETLQQLSVDGRTDLYAVGACPYYAITAQHAYPAHSFTGLYAAWCTPPALLSSFVPDVPLALEQLVQSLLSLEPSDRPRTAAEVYERLTVTANLTRAEARGVAQAYVTKPKLVAREAQLVSLRDAAEDAAIGEGRALLVSAPSGLGRSRLLDAAVLEARRAGLRVARADATIGRVNALGVANQLLNELSSDDQPSHERARATFDGALDSEARERKISKTRSTCWSSATSRGCCAASRTRPPHASRSRAAMSSLR